MKLKITNTSGATVDAVVGSLAASASTAVELTPEKYYRLMSRLKTLVDDKTLKIEHLQDSNIASGHDIPSSFKLRVNVKDFGAIGDGVADDTAAIQAAIDFAIYQNGPGITVYLPPGFYKTSDTIHLGYGTTFASIIFEGDLPIFVGFASAPVNNFPFSGACIVPTFSDRPAVNIQGARGTTIRNMSFKGKLATWVETNNLTGIAPTVVSVDDTDPDNWDDPDLAATADSRYAPYAAITIDAYCGTQPATHYPDVTFPAFLGAVSQYGKAFSSDVLIENVGITGFTVGIANQPSDADGNGDFTCIRRLNLDKCKWGISVCNTQSRNVSISDCKMGVVYTALTNCKHGRQSGKFNGTILNLSLGQVIQVFEFAGTSITGPIEFTNLYGEAMWRIGSVNLPTAAETSVRFRESLLSFEGQDASEGGRGVPGLLMGPVSSDICDIAFTGCIFNNFVGVASFGHFAHFDGCMFFSNEFATTEAASISDPYRRFAVNFLAGGCVTPRFEHVDREQKIKYTPVSLSTGTRLANLNTSDNFRWATRDVCVANCLRSIRPSNDGWRTSIPVPQFTSQPIDKATLISHDLTNGVLTITLPSLPDWQAMMYGGMPGDVIWDQDSGTVFFIRSRTTTTIIAEQQNNYKVVSGNWELLTDIEWASGYLYVANSRFYTTHYSLLADLTSGSATLTNVGRADGYGAFTTLSLAENDWIWINDMDDLPFAVAGNIINNINSGALTITMNSPANYTQVHKKFSIFIRPGPDNQGSR